MLLRGDTIHAIYVRRFVCKLHSVKMDTLVSILCKYQDMTDTHTVEDLLATHTW